MIARVGAARHALYVAAEGVAMARTQPIVTTVTGLVVAAVCAVIFATVGQSAAAEARILTTFDEAGTRTIVISDPTGRAVLTPDSVDAVRSLAGVDWVVGLGPVIDVRNVALSAAGRPVPARRVYGGLPESIRLIGGRAPRVGEAIASDAALRLLGLPLPVGGVQGEGLAAPLVGSFAALDPLSSLERGLLIPADAGLRPEALRQLVVVSASVEEVETLSRAILAVVHVADRTQLRIQTPAALIELRRLVDQELATSSRQMLLVVLGVGLLVVMVTLAGSVAQRRRDFGRRRALGATRSALVMLVLVQTAVAALVGVLLGTAIGVAAVSRIAGALPSLEFTASVGILALLTALAAAVPPGIVAAYRDPMHVLRVP